jgi:hypothetical protein
MESATAARFCVESYFAELDRRLDEGFDLRAARPVVRGGVVYVVENPSMIAAAATRARSGPPMPAS